MKKTIAAFAVALLAPLLLSPPPASATTGLKPALGGLMTRGVPDSTQAAYLGGFAVVADWRELEPQRGTYSFATIDTRLARARSYGLGVRLRVIAGTQAPDWAKAIGGAPMPAYDHQRKVTTSIGRFWTPAYQTAWQELQRALAARYDADPTVREVNVSGTGVISAEVLLLMANDKLPTTGQTNGSYWLAAGYTEAARQTALRTDIDFMAATWAHTPLDLCLHALQVLDPSGRTPAGSAATLALWDTARAAHPGLHAFNTGFGTPVITGQQAALTEIYNGLLARHAPLDVQTLNLDAGMGDPTTVLNWAASHGVLSLELPSGKDWLSWSRTLLSTTNTKLKANTSTGTPTALRIGASPTSITLGQSTTVSGRLVYASTGEWISGQPVQVYARRVGTTAWSMLATVTTGSDGLMHYSRAIGGTAEFFLQFPGAGAFAPTTSSTVTVTVH